MIFPFQASTVVSWPRQNPPQNLSPSANAKPYLAAVRLLSPFKIPLVSVFSPALLLDSFFRVIVATLWRQHIVC